MFSGFTAKEKTAVIFLLFSFIAGLFLYWYRSNFGPVPQTSSISFKQYEGISNKQEDLNKKQNKLEKKQTKSGIIKIDINKGTAEDFEKLPGIGKATALKIIKYRDSAGRFKKLEEITNVRGIGEKTFKKIEPYIFIKNQ